jgi:hypothetical protein
MKRETCGDFNIPPANGGISPSDYSAVTTKTGL